MDLSLELSLSTGNSESVTPFIPENTQFDECGHDGVYQPRVKPTLLSLFPLARAGQLSNTRDSTQSVLGHDTQHISDGESGTVDVNTRDSERISGKHGRLAPRLSTYQQSGYVQDESLHQTSLRVHQQDLSIQITSGASSLDFINLVPFQRPGCQVPSPSQDPSEISPTAKGQRFEADRELIVLGPFTELCNSTAISPTKEWNGAGSASSSRAAAQNFPHVTPNFTTSENTSAANLDVEAVGALSNQGRKPPRSNPRLNQGRRPPRPIQGGRLIPRPGPRPRSSPYRGVTHYLRTGRWEAHIWHKGKQIYLGASSTAEKAAGAYDRAATHFRGVDAELNFYPVDYASELRQLVELSDTELVLILRKQSAGEGSLYPDYPPIRLQRDSRRIIGA